MARLFVDTSSQGLRRDAAVVTPPFTMSVWARPDDNTSGLQVFFIGDKDFDNQRWIVNFAGNVAGDPIRVNRQSGATSVSTDTGNGFTINEWSHVFLRAPAANDIEVMLNGDTANTGTSTANRPANSWDRTSIGQRDDTAAGAYFSGRIAEFALWSTGLTIDDGVALSAGMSPLQIVPESLAAYVPIYGLTDPEEDWLGANNFTVLNGPISQAEHAPVYAVGGWSVATFDLIAARLSKPIGTPARIAGVGGGLAGR